MHLLPQELLELFDKRTKLVARPGRANNGLEVQLQRVTVQVKDRIGEAPRLPAFEGQIDELRRRLRLGLRELKVVGGRRHTTDEDTVRP